MTRVRPFAGRPLAISSIAMSGLASIGVPIALFLGLALAIVPPVAAQHTGVATSAPPPPPPTGNGSLTVQVVHRDDPTQAAGLSLALYALSSDGSPGFASGQTAADGTFVFTNISTDPSIIYLVGARFSEIPFGERMTFAEGETEARIEIEVMAPTEQTSGIAIKELRIRLDWMGDRIIVREAISLSNTGDRVIQLPADDRSRSIVVRRVGTGARDFTEGAGSIGDNLALEKDEIRFWGPLYPGEQQIEYQYSLLINTIETDADGTLRVPVALGQPVSRLVVIAGTAGLGLQGEELIASIDLQSDSGSALKSWVLDGLGAGETFEIELRLPESRFDPSLISVPRGDVWIELDDTRLTATIDIQIEVEPGAPVSGSPDAPLLHVSIPKGATLQGVAPEAEALGLIPTGDSSGDDVGFDVVGPIGPGTTSLGYSYFMPARPNGIEINMRFPGEVQTLNVLIADTGLALDSSRLHRRRPFRSGTRNYLHREAFNITRGEVVDLSLVPLGATGLPQPVSVGLALAAAVAGAFFLFAPLRTAARETALPESPLDRIQAKRELVYTAIRDLDHDYETAKLEEADYTQMREELRAEAIELLRAEREASGGEGDPPEASASSASASVAPDGEAQTGTFCPSCGETVTASWQFCSHCGGDLNPSEQASE